MGIGVEDKALDLVGEVICRNGVEGVDMYLNMHRKRMGVAMRRNLMDEVEEDNMRRKEILVVAMRLSMTDEVTGEDKAVDTKATVEEEIKAIEGGWHTGWTCHNDLIFHSAASA